MAKSEGPQVDPTAEADKARRAAEEERTTRTSHELGDGRIYPSDITAVAQQHNLTDAEAEVLLREGGDITADRVDAVKSGRYVYRQTYEKVPAVMSPLAQADLRAAALEAEGEVVVEAVPDRTKPEAGPYGPHADYREASVSAEEIVSQGAVPAEVGAAAAAQAQREAAERAVNR